MVMVDRWVGRRLIKGGLWMQTRYGQACSPSCPTPHAACVWYCQPAIDSATCASAPVLAVLQAEPWKLLHASRCSCSPPSSPACSQLTPKLFYSTGCSVIDVLFKPPPKLINGEALLYLLQLELAPAHLTRIYTAAGRAASCPFDYN